MAKNYMEKVANMLGMRLGEEFIIENQDRKETVVIALDGLHVIQPNNVLSPDHGKLLSKVLQGLYEVKKKQWEPKKGEVFYFIDVKSKAIIWDNWSGNTRDYAMQMAGVIYKTSQEAYSNMKADYEKLTGKKLEE